MEIRAARPEDLPGIESLLLQVCAVHHEGRPDLFRLGRKYRREELLQILEDETAPVLVAIGEAEQVLGYAFCRLQQILGDNVRTDVRTLYLDDLCVEQTQRGSGIGHALFDAVKRLAAERNCYNLTLNVWACNPAARRFYEGLGMVPQKTCMELIL